MAAPAKNPITKARRMDMIFIFSKNIRGGPSPAGLQGTANLRLLLRGARTLQRLLWISP
jgi:hypothetical protein